MVYSTRASRALIVFREGPSTTVHQHPSQGSDPPTTDHQHPFYRPPTPVLPSTNFCCNSFVIKHFTWTLRPYVPTSLDVGTWGRGGTDVGSGLPGPRRASLFAKGFRVERTSLRRVGYRLAARSVLTRRFPLNRGVRSAVVGIFGSVLRVPGSRPAALHWSVLPVRARCCGLPGVFVSSHWPLQRFWWVLPPGSLTASTLEPATTSLAWGPKSSWHGTQGHCSPIWRLGRGCCWACSRRSAGSVGRLTAGSRFRTWLLAGGADRGAALVPPRLLGERCVGRHAGPVATGLRLVRPGRSGGLRFIRPIRTCEWVGPPRRWRWPVVSERRWWSSDARLRAAAPGAMLARMDGRQSKPRALVSGGQGGAGGAGPCSSCWRYATWW